MFFILGNPDPLVRGTDPDRIPLSHKGVERTEIMVAKKFLTQNLVN
jgi:hypothetical protein